MAKFIVKEKLYAGTYANPYKSGGFAVKMTRWKTISAHATLEEALSATRFETGLRRRAVFYRGHKISEGAAIIDQGFLDDLIAGR